MLPDQRAPELPIRGAVADSCDNIELGARPGFRQADENTCGVCSVGVPLVKVLECFSWKGSYMVFGPLTRCMLRMRISPRNGRCFGQQPALRGRTIPRMRAVPRPSVRAEQDRAQCDQIRHIRSRSREWPIPGRLVVRVGLASRPPSAAPYVCGGIAWLAHANEAFGPILLAMPNSGTHSPLLSTHFSPTCPAPTGTHDATPGFTFGTCV